MIESLLIEHAKLDKTRAALARLLSPGRKKRGASRYSPDFKKCRIIRMFPPSFQDGVVFPT
jgi:hypothetical protein